MSFPCVNLITAPLLKTCDGFRSPLGWRPGSWRELPGLHHIGSPSAPLLALPAQTTPVSFAQLFTGRIPTPPALCTCHSCGLPDLAHPSVSGHAHPSLGSTFPDPWPKPSVLPAALREPSLWLYICLCHYSIDPPAAGSLSHGQKVGVVQTIVSKWGACTIFKRLPANKSRAHCSFGHWFPGAWLGLLGNVLLQSPGWPACPSTEHCCSSISCDTFGSRAQHGPPPSNREPLPSAPGRARRLPGRRGADAGAGGSHRAPIRRVTQGPDRSLTTRKYTRKI